MGFRILLGFGVEGLGFSVGILEMLISITSVVKMSVELQQPGSSIIEV